MALRKYLHLILVGMLCCTALDPALAARRAGNAGSKKSPYKAQIKQLTAQAKTAISMGDYPEAEKLARTRLNLEATAYGENHRSYGGALNLLGRVLFEEGNYEEAEALMRRGLALRERLVGVADERTARSLLQLGRLLAARDNYAEAESILRRALAIRGADALPEGHAIAQLRLGHAMLDLGRYAEADAAASQAIAVLDRAFPGQRRGKVALALELLAQSKDAQGRPAEAQEMARRALAITRRSQGEEHPHTGDALLFLGRLLHELKRDEEAQELLLRARTISEKALGSRHPQTSRANLELALVRDALGQFEAAEDGYRAALKGAHSADIPLQLAQTARAYGRFLVARGRLQDALPQYREAVKMLERVFAETRGQSEEIRQQFAGRFNVFHHELIELLLQLHMRDQGKGYNREALEVGSLTQSRIFSELLREADVNQFSREPAFAGLIRQRTAAVDRLRALRRELAASGVKLEQDADEDEDDDDDDEDELDGAAATSATASAQQISAQLDNLLRQIGEAKQQLAGIEDALRKSYPRYMELTQPQPINVTELQQRLLRPGEVLLSYALLPRQLVVFAVTGEDFIVTSVPLAREEVAAKIRAARAPEEENSAGGSLAALKKLDPANLNWLYRMLVQPLDAVIARAERVLVVGDGPIHTLPLEMLVTRYGDEDRAAFIAARGRGPQLAEYATLSYLGARTRFAYLPSLAALASQREYRKPAVNYDRELVSFADPVFEAEAGGGGVMAAPTRAALITLAGSVRGNAAQISIPRLPETADEANEIAAILGGNARVYLRKDAQEHTVKSLDLKTTRYLHFATHGFLGGEFLLVKAAGREGELSTAGTQRNLVVGAGASTAAEPTAAAGPPPGSRGGQPALALTLVGDLRGEDGLLTMKEVIENLDLNAQLVVLSACNTAGENAEANNGEGFAGLTRAFMYAGAKGQLVSHWSVESISTQQFMTAVFRNLKAGQSTAQALFEARQSIFATTSSSGSSSVSRAHPYFWAPFVYVGD